MLWLLGYKIGRLANEIHRRVTDKSSKILLSNTSRQLLERILADKDSGELRTAEDKYLLLDHVRKTLCEGRQADALESHYAIFMLTKIHGDVP